MENPTQNTSTHTHSSTSGFTWKPGHMLYFRQSMGNHHGVKLKFTKKYYFPLVRRPFEVFSLLSPCNPFEALKAEGNDLSVCRGKDYNHLLEEKVYNTNEEPCDKLRKYYPFVSITEMNESHVIESLEYNNSVIQTVLVQKVC